MLLQSLSNNRFDCPTWVWLQYRCCFPGRTDTATGGGIHWHRAGAVVQWPCHRGRTYHYIQIERCTKLNEVKFLLLSKIGLKCWCSESVFPLLNLWGCVSPVWMGICPPDAPAKKSWLQIGELWLYTSSSSIDKNLSQVAQPQFNHLRTCIHMWQYCGMILVFTN